MLTIFPGAARAEMQQHQRQNWFPPPSSAYAVSSSSQLAPAVSATDDRDLAIAPLPPAAATGLTGLAALGLMSCRKAVKRFFS